MLFAMDGVSEDNDRTCEERVTLWQASSHEEAIQRAEPRAGGSSSTMTVEELRASGAVENEPHMIFGHEDDALGPAEREEWQPFISDSENNVVGLVSHHPHS